MEEQVRNLIAGNDKCEIDVVAGDQLLELGMNMIHAVGRCAKNQARCVVVKYRGDPSSEGFETALVGKGVTYDTGGLNLKGTGNMELMYGDKGGSCAVIGALKGAMKMNLKKNIIFSMGFAENGIGASAYKPSDIIKSMNGLQVEIGNTDAEGRLVMGDVITYVQRKYSPKQVVDIATLTGACMVALGKETAGIFINDDDILAELKAASKQSFEPVWHLPITDEHK